MLYYMASLKRCARMTTDSFIDLMDDESKDISLSDSIIELFVTVGYLGADVKAENINKLDVLIC